MKSDIQLYPDFIKALKENDIVYLFGAGFSTALSGRKYTWWDQPYKRLYYCGYAYGIVEGKDYIIGSCKYRNEKIGVDELDLIRDYASVFGKGNHYHYYIFSKGGFTDGLLQAQECGEVRLITLEDLYK